MQRPALALAFVAAAGCAQPPSTGTAPPPPVNSTLETVVAAARADAAKRTGIAPEALVLVGAQAVTWSDGSLGCPQPGRMYSQALVPGFRVRLRSPTELLDYHASARGGLVLCPADRAVPPVPGNAAI